MPLLYRALLASHLADFVTLGWVASAVLCVGRLHVYHCRFGLLVPTITAKPKPTPWPGTINFIRRPKTLMAYGLLASVSGGSFLLIPSFATYMQFNLGFPREQMSLIYLVAGAVTLVAQQVAGWMSDKWSLSATSWVGFGFITVSLVTGFIADPPLISVWIFFPLFMISGAMRIVAANTASSLVPEAHERSAHMALQSGMRHLCSGFAGVLSAWILVSSPSGELSNVWWLACVTLIVALAQPLLMMRLEPQLNR